MALNSVNTNVGAMVALQNLQKTNAELDITQNRINTGKAVNSAKDNGAIWAIAQSQRSESASLNAVKSSLQRGQSTVDVALSAGESISDLLTQMKTLALSASDASLGTSARASLNEDFINLRNQITTVVANASFDGTNLINAGTAGFKALANAKGTSTINVAQQNLSLGGTIVTVAAAGAIATASTAATMITTVDTSIKNVSTALSKLGTGSKAFENHLTFVGKLQDSLDAGVGNLVDADLAKESARLQSLQTKQQLGVQALSIANSSTSILLGLFR
ncbi:flagellin [uncultured Brevundimonas sp.]|uniref:flagellin n=1 Tax=uncultured Brevundimonas sp. TaxID=213418 RepID=UPI0025E25116|nr:flagellin [uncultured Brevundimonas sp.]